MGLALLIAVAVIYAGTLPWREERLVQRIEAGEKLSESELDLPFASKPGFAYAKRVLESFNSDLTEAERQIERSIRNRPLNADAWLLRAQIALRQGKTEQAIEYTETARRIWPNWNWTLWPAAMLFIQEGENERALDALKAYLRARPREVSRVLVAASRLTDNPDNLLNAVIPEELPKDQKPDYYLVQALRYAMSVKNSPLAQVAWSRIRPLPGSREQLGIAYLNYLVSQKEAERAAEVWFDMTQTQASEQTTNGSFEKELYDGGFGWVTRPVKGAEVERTSDQSIDGRYSLQISFDGTENVNFFHVYQTVPVKPGQSYEVSFYWRGEGITTRSDPYVEIFTIGADRNSHKRSEANRKSWSWTKETLEIKVPDDAYFLRIRLRRNKTDDLDKLIAGKIWLDELAIKPVTLEE